MVNGDDLAANIADDEMQSIYIAVLNCLDGKSARVQGCVIANIAATFAEACALHQGLDPKGVLINIRREATKIIEMKLAASGFHKKPPKRLDG